VLIAYVWPEPQSSAAGLRNRNLIEALGRFGYEVVIASAAQNEPGRVSCERWSHEWKGVTVRPIQLNHSSFDQWISEEKPDLVVFDRFVVEEQFGWRVREFAPQATCILDTSDLHFLRVSREKGFKSPMSGATLAGRAAGIHWDVDLACRELASIHRVDLAWLVSGVEHELLIREFGVDPSRVAVSRFAYPDPAEAPGAMNGFLQRSGFCLLGNFRHAPNLDAFRWMRAEVWPRIRAQLPAVELHVYGAYPTKEVMEAHSPRSGFLVHGRAESLTEVFAPRRVSLAPLRFGAGIKGKISDSWWHGVPVVSTSIGSEGMSDGGTWGGRIGNSTEDFVQACVELHESKAQWEQAREGGVRVLRAMFSVESFDRDFEAGLNQAEAGRRRRESDWIRRMMLHSTQDSYRYFGKWLELKQARKSP
jgi:hypothetical protein